MKIQQISKVKGGRQDGAVFGDYYFSFNHRGECTVYRMDALDIGQDGEAEIFSEFVLDKSDIIMPHSNSVTFGNEYFDEKDEFPLLYTNIYNNYAKAENPLKGVCLVYRLQRCDKHFETKLVQMFEVGFVEDETLWKSAVEPEDVRPYGNFAMDADNGILYAFTMRDNTQSTRYFSFPLPKVTEGELCETYGVKKVVLREEDLLQYFDCDYHHYVQGACCSEGKIYSLEGFTDSVENPPAIRVIDAQLQKEILYKQFDELGTNIEPEMIDFENGICYYTDHHGNMYIINFQE